MSPDLDTLLAAIQASAKYRAISPELIRAVGARELKAHRSLKAAIKETKNKLHQVAGAYLERPPDYPAWLDLLRAAADRPEARAAACQTIMGHHASTRERLPQLERCYREIFAALPPVGRLLDLACGLNPLAAPWMGLPPGSFYQACDLYADMCAFIDAALPLLGQPGAAEVCDLSGASPPWPADVALILKTLPVLEQIRRGAARDLLDAVRAPHLVVSFPTRSLGGRNVGMAESYAALLRGICDPAGWPILAELTFVNEVVFVVQKG